jgi:RHS repeat-associated protein
MGAYRAVSAFVHGTHVNVPELIVKGTTTYRILHDHLGSARLVIDRSTGAVAQRLDYDEWGQISLDTNPGFQPFGFAGGVYNDQTKLVRFGARDYDPQVGRWTAKDQLGLRASFAMYAYSEGDPVNAIDPQGLQPTPTPTPPVTPSPSPTPRPCCNGKWEVVHWERRFSLLNVFGPKCYCWWLCIPCSGSYVWSGNFTSLPVTEGRVIYTGGEGLRRGDACFCGTPGPQTGCGE